MTLPLIPILRITSLSQPLQSFAATNFTDCDKFHRRGKSTLSQGGIFMADDMDKKNRQGNQYGKDQQTGQSGQTGQTGQNQNQPKKGNQGQNENEENDQNRDRQRRAS